LHKFEVTTGEHEGQQLNALESADESHLEYFPHKNSGEQKTSQKKLKNKKIPSHTNPAAEFTPRTDDRFKQFHDFAFETFRAKFHQAPTWGGRDRKSLSHFLRQHAQVTATEWQLRWQHFLDSTDDFVRRQGASLSYFIARFDSFREGPLLRDLRRVLGVAEQGSGSPVRAESGKYERVPVRRFENNGKMQAV
jgi:hypothetical protein